MSKQQQQTDNEIRENQLLSFLVDFLNGEVTPLLVENAELNAKDIYEVLAGTYTDGTPIPMLCEGDEDASHENSVFYHFRARFDFETLEQVGSTSLQKNTLDVLPQQVEVISDLHL